MMSQTRHNTDQATGLCSNTSSHRDAVLLASTVNTAIENAETTACSGQDDTAAMIEDHAAPVTTPNGDENRPTMLQIQQQKQDLHPSKQIIRKINSCGTDCSKALDILYETQPFLKNNDMEEIRTPLPKDLQKNNGTFDAKVIVAVIQLLAKHGNYSTPLDLLSNVIQLHKSKIVPTYYLLSVYKSIIGMLALQEQKVKLINLHRQILHYIYVEIPNNIQGTPPMDVYHVTLSALGKCRQMDAILDLLNRMETQQTITHTVFQDNNDMENQNVLDNLPWKHPLPDRMAYLTALNSGIRCKSPVSSMEIMNRMKSRGMALDAVVYNHVLSSLANKKIIQRYELVKDIWHDMEGMNMCTDATYKLLIQIFTKECQWSDVAVAKSRMEAQQTGSSSLSVVMGSTSSGQESVAVDPKIEPLIPGYIADLEKLEKGSTFSKKPWYKVGRVRVDGQMNNHLMDNTIVFGIQQHKNPILNGLSLVFYTVTGEKLGYVLIRNELVNSQVNHEVNANGEGKGMFYSSIMGMFIDECHRGKGLARYFLGIWLSICLRTHAFPQSEKINKPLLSLVLSNFGFQAVSDGAAVEVEVCPIEHIQETTTCTLGPIADLGWKPKFALYTKQLMNFSERELRIQSMIVTRVPPNPRGKVIAVKTCFEHPMTQNARKGQDFVQERSQLAESVRLIWGKSSEESSSHVDFFIEDELLKRIIF
eukprot:CAMPEP_0176483458 /NCGR_PEP_ID=MMETSP0200_2-20121128/3929_1 /TAXON_ID=947934 /ORGANISM="Chaetoceros sp., Strain GSL56" /LENGTH=703 /DNA_ID=CAMNT_0017879861 /DNA_START=237 /DNA_END=2345 /DNA_ORIENTATION=+